MAVSEQERHQLHSTLERVLGEREAATMMALTPPIGWGDVSRRSDVDHLGVLTNTQLEQFRAEMNGRFVQFETAMSGRFAQLETAMSSRFEQFRTEMDARFDQTEERFERKLSESQNKLMIFVTTTTLTAIIAVAGIAFTAAGLT